MNPLQVLLIGNQQRSEFRSIRPSLEGVVRLEEAHDLAQGYALVEKGAFVPDLLLLLQSIPGEFAPGALEAFRRLSPLTQIGVILGPWCEGEGRSGKPLPGTWRIDWHQWSARWGQQLQRWRQEQCPLWGMPPTSIEEDRLLADSPPPAGARQARIGLCSLRPHLADWLFAALHAWGFQPQWLFPPFRAPRPIHDAPPAKPADSPQEPPEKGPSLESAGPPVPSTPELKSILFDATDADGEEALWLQHLGAGRDRPRIVLLVDFPRPELWERVAPWGVQAILGKPIALGDLVWHLDQLENNGT